MKKILIPALTAALLCSSAFALETSVAPKVTDIKNHSPKTGLIVGNSYSLFERLDTRKQTGLESPHHYDQLRPSLLS